MWEVLPLAHMQHWNMKPARCGMDTHAHNSSLPSSAVEADLGEHLTELALHFKYRRGYTNENLHRY